VASEFSPDDSDAILIGLGANLPSRYGDPVATLKVALGLVQGAGVTVVGRSRVYESAPVPAAAQPWFVNGVARLESSLTAGDLLHLLHRVEARLGRVRAATNAPRCVDLDLLSYRGRVNKLWPILPHPRLAERAFVLLPLSDVAPGWRHPETGRTPAEMLNSVDPAQITRLLEPAKPDPDARQS